jgi:PST family polysaccharide transporter
VGHLDVSLSKDTLLVGCSIAGKTASLFALNKIFASTLGPSGYVVIGQTQNIMTFVTNICGGSLSHGVTSLVAKNNENPQIKNQIVVAAITLSSALAAGLALLLYQFQELLSTDRIPVFRGISLLLPIAFLALAGAISQVFQAVLLGNRESAKYTTRSLIAVFLSSGVAALLVITAGVDGAVLGIILQGSISLMVFIADQKVQIKHVTSQLTISISRVPGLLKYYLAALTASIVSPGVQYTVREMIVSSVGMHQAGIWQATQKLGESYVALISAILAVHFLPRLSATTTSRELMRVLRNATIIIVCIVGGVGCFVYIARSHLVSFLFSVEFAAAADLIHLQIVGDLLKMLGWLFSFASIARGWIIGYAAGELGYGAVYLYLSERLIPHYGTEGALLSFCVAYLFYAVFGAVWVINRSNREQ